MDDVQKLRDELALAELAQPLEEAREAMHGNRSPENIAAYKEQSKAFAAARTAFREKYPTPVPAEGDGVAEVETVQAGGGVHQGGAQ